LEKIFIISPSTSDNSLTSSDSDSRISKHNKVFYKVNDLHKKILVAEDQENNKLVIVGMLKHLGYTNYTVVSNGKEALEKINDAIADDNKFDILLLDLKMPVLDGFETAKRLQKYEEAPYIIALTAIAMRGDKEKLMSNHLVSDYITKPIEIEKLIEALNKAV
jgi:CheY-like chemotaxis protein